MGRMNDASGLAGPNRPRRILLADDSVINCAVVTAILEKHGHSIITVHNGAEAVAAVRREPFDVVLMDVQMPGMDGLEATKLIRKGERGTGRRLAIIAFTSQARLGDRDACLDAGMDSYLVKPVQTDVLLTAIDAAASRDVAGSGLAGESPFDEAGVLDRIENDLGLLAELVKLFGAESRRMLGELRAALHAGDGKAIEILAHTLRGSAANLGGVTAARAALTVELMGREGDLAGADAGLAALERESASLERSLHNLVKRELECESN
jgi:two-component system sensor histidine kinase/response regulator